jgi:SRSO17 transposase
MVKAVTSSKLSTSTPLKFIVAIRSNHGVWMPQGQRVRYTRWKKFDRLFSNGGIEVRYIREIIFGKRRAIRYWQITTDAELLPDNCTWFIMTNLPGDIQKSVGNTYGLRTWLNMVRTYATVTSTGAATPCPVPKN